LAQEQHFAQSFPGRTREAENSAAMSEVELPGGPAGTQPQIFGASSSGLRARGRSPREDEEEDHDLITPQEPLTPDERTWAKGLVAITGLDILSSGTVVIVSFSHAYRDDGVSLACLGMQALSHWISSVLMVTRFLMELRPIARYELSSGLSEEALLHGKRRRSLAREQVLSITMSIVMLLSSCAMLFKAMRKFKMWDRWYTDHTDMDNDVQQTTEVLAWWGFSTYAIQAGVRLVAACKLQRSIVWHAFVASVVSTLFLLVLGIAAVEEKEWSWKAEPIAAMVLSVVVVFEAVRIVYMHFDDVDFRMRYDPRA